MPRGIYDRKKSKPGKSAAKLAKVETKVSARNEAVSFVYNDYPVVRVWRSDSRDVVAFLDSGNEFEGFRKGLAALKIPLTREREDD